MGSQPQLSLPTIDFTTENLKPGTSSWHFTSNKVRQSLEDYGCFLALQNRVSSKLNKDVFPTIQPLFDLLLETKLKNISGKPYYNYIGQAPTVPLFESLGIQDATIVEGIESFAKLMYEETTDCKNFSKTMHSYAKEVSEVERIVNKMLFESYGVEKVYESHIESTTYLLRAIKYRLPEEGETNIGAETHTDKSFITILHQNQVNGLEVKMRDGEWITVQFPPSSFLVMAGDAISAWSNGRVYSAFHRVVVTGDEERYSLGLFSYINGMIHIPEVLVDDKHPRQFQSFDHFESLDSFAIDVAKQGILYCDRPLIKSINLS